MKKVALIGSTGSIGSEVVRVCEKHPDKFNIISIAAGYNTVAFLEQLNKLKPKVACFCKNLKEDKNLKLIDNIQYYFGEESFLDAIINEADIVVVALVGFIGIKAVLKAIELKKDIALANKESLVVGGSLIMEEIKKNNINLIPIDSEHSAIWQALNFDRNREFKKLIITSSGGAFRNLEIDKLEKVTAKDALKHPTWNMGKKITIDCATMINKGFEVIEAMWLFNAKMEDIEVVIHPESIIHSAVEYKDNSIIAELSYPTMEIPIQIALSYPERLDSRVESLDFFKVKTLNFLKIDEDKYPCFYLALKAMQLGDNYPAALNASNEIAVNSFLNGEIKFTDISKIINYALNHTNRVKIDNCSILYKEDKKARELAKSFIGELNDK